MHEVRLERLQVALAQVELLLGQHDDAAAFRRFVGERGELRGVGELGFACTPSAGRKAAAWRLPSVMVPVLSSSSTSTSPAASTARPEVAMTLACIMRLMPATPMAESSAGDGGRDQADQQRDQHGDADRRARAGHVDAEQRERQQRHGDAEEDDGQRRQQDGQRDLVGRLLPLGALDHGDHAVDEGLARD